MIAPEDPGEDVVLRARGGFQRRNLALARAAAEAFHGRLDPEVVAAVAAGVTIPGRLEQIADEPADLPRRRPQRRRRGGARRGAARGRRAVPVTACLAMLADKDAAGAVAALAPVLERVVCTEIPAETLHSQGRPGASVHPAGDLADLPRRGPRGGGRAETSPRRLPGPGRWPRPPGGTLLITGSHYLLAPARAALAS